MGNILIMLGIIAIFIAGASFIIWRIRNHYNYERSLDMVFLKLRVPIADAKEDRERSVEAIGSTSTFRETLAVMSHFYDSIYAIYDGNFRNIFIGETFFSCEIVLIGKELYFYFVVPRNIKHILQKHHP